MEVLNFRIRAALKILSLTKSKFNKFKFRPSGLPPLFIYLFIIYLFTDRLGIDGFRPPYLKQVPRTNLLVTYLVIYIDISED
ncbi:hypothetical protein Pse7367_2414 [Thalassoporum mexicanum PCC 7367]|nr:hypothetical protein Pse7367_2414 [Pseudanabaena sp. PCC 7367]